MFLGGGRGGLAQRTVLHVNEPKKKGARSAGGVARPNPTSFYNRVPSIEEESERKCISLMFHQMYESPLSPRIIPQISYIKVSGVGCNPSPLHPPPHHKESNGERKVNPVLLTGREFGRIT